MSNVSKDNMSMDSNGFHPGSLAVSGNEREWVATRINQALNRFELILSILEELSALDMPAAGDADLRHGCERALTSMLAEVASIEPTEPSSGPPGPEERIAKAWLENRESCQLIDQERLEYLWLFIDGLLPPAF